MTALNAPILFNTSQGSDTQSSGSSAGANVYGTGASTTASSAVVTGIDTTGVVAGDLLWVQSSSGRQFSVIASVDSSTQVTCDDQFANTESSRTWAIGGRRATLGNAVQLFESDYRLSTRTIVELETDQTITGSLSGSGSVYTNIVVRSNNSTKRKITCGDQYTIKGGTEWEFYNINFESNYSGSAVFALASTNNLIQTCYWRAYDCIFGNSTNPYSSMMAQNSRTALGYFHGCIIQDFTGNIYNNGSSYHYNCLIRNNQSRVVSNNNIYGTYATFIDCIIHDNVEFIYSHGNITGILLRNIIHNCGTNEPVIRSNGSWGTICRTFEGNIFSNCSSSFNTTSPYWSARNNYYYNSSISSLPDEQNPITLTADPFVDAANGDFNLNATNGGGGTLRSTNYTLGG
jgi:hypothetical protein